MVIFDQDSVCCPNCCSHDIICNGHKPNGKQNHLCADCGRAFVLKPDWIPVSEATKAMLRRSLAERNSIRAMARIFCLSVSWVMDFVNTEYRNQPKDLNCWIGNEDLAASNLIVECQADELWSFVKSKDQRQWIWLVLEEDSRQIVAFHIGGRTIADAEKLWDNIPNFYKENGYYHTDYLVAYQHIFDDDQHSASGKETGKTCYIERVNNTFRQRCSRLVRKTLSFSKKLDNHIEAIRYFIRQYNAERIALLY